MVVVGCQFAAIHQIAAIIVHKRMIPKYLNGRDALFFMVALCPVQNSSFCLGDVAGGAVESGGEDG